MQNLYKIKLSKFSRLRLWFLSWLDVLLNFFSLKTSKRFWGVVYDSVSKEPLDPVIVKLLYTDGREVDTCITDLAGRYGFLARPGKFKIFARKTNYNFPSQRVLGSTDGIYENLYHGEFFMLTGDAEVVAPNIPMDPAARDWNQTAKRGLSDAHFYLKLLFKRLIAVLFWFALIFCLFEIWRLKLAAPLYVDAIAVFILLMLFLAVIFREPRLWGKVKIKRLPVDPDGLQMELFNYKFPEVGQGKAHTRLGGKFLLRANPGKYLLAVSYLNEDKELMHIGKVPVKIGRSGVLNSTVVIR